MIVSNSIKHEILTKSLIHPVNTPTNRSNLELEGHPPNMLLSLNSQILHDKCY